MNKRPQARRAQGRRIPSSRVDMPTPFHGSGLCRSVTDRSSGSRIDRIAAPSHPHRQWHQRRSSPVTAAGPRRIHTGFPWNSIQNDASPSGCDRREQAKDAGSVRSSATDATEDEGWLRLARTRRPGLRSETSSQCSLEHPCVGVCSTGSARLSTPELGNQDTLDGAAYLAACRRGDRLSRAAPRRQSPRSGTSSSAAPPAPHTGTCR